MTQSPQLIEGTSENHTVHPQNHVYEQDEIDADPIFETPTRPPPRSGGKKSAGGNSSKKMTPGMKWKRRLHRNEGIDGPCHLLNLPVGVLHELLAGLPPRSLKALSVTCKTLQDDLSDESIWRQSYANRFLWDGAARSLQGRGDVKLLVQGCMGDASRGWRKEALNREAMLDRWTVSKQDMVIHHPPIGLIHSLSLSYPTYSPPTPRSLVVGKTHQTPSKAGSSSTPSSTPSANGDEPASSTPSKMTHRQKYEALIAATTRPAPYVLSASMFLGSIVRSDPLSGKASKGFWGPGRDANFHLRPHLDQTAEPSAIYLSTRSQTQSVWGLVNGTCVHTTLASKSQSSQGGRAASINVLSAVEDAHEGEICDIWMDEQQESSGPTRWVTGGTDGRIKYWQLTPAEPKTTGKRSPAGDLPGTITCLFTSSIIQETLLGRSEYVKRRQSGKPDDIAIVRCDTVRSIICGVTEDGDLRIWFSAGTRHVQEVRVDVGSAEDMGGVKRLELDAHTDDSVSVLLHHDRAFAFTRHNIVLSQDGEYVVTSTKFTSPVGAFSAIHACLRAAPPISIQAIAPPVLSTPFETDEDESRALSSRAPSPSQSSPTESERYGRFVVTGDEHGIVCIWRWDHEENEETKPLRVWSATHGRITAIDASCGLVAIGSFDGYIKVYDPLPSPPTLLRSFHSSRLSSADLLVAASHEPDARYFNVNQIILENDLVVASIGRKVFAWKAGTGKGRTKVDSHRRASAQKNDSKGSLKPLDKKSIRQETMETQAEIRSSTAQPVRQSNYERAQFAAMDDLGLDDGDDALQYALMLSMDEQATGDSVPGLGEPSIHQGHNDVDAGVGTGADAELQEMLEMIRVAEEEEAGRARTS